MFNVLIYICLSVFAVTSVITLLGLLKIVKLEKTYMNRLFTALILQIVTVGIFGFKNFIYDHRDPYIRLTFPTNDLSTENNNIVINGLALLNKENYIEVNINEKKYFPKVNEKEIFFVTHSLKVGYNDLKIRTRVMENSKMVTADSSQIIIYYLKEN